MADKNFVVKNGIVVNTAFSANSTNVSFTGANLTINTTAFSVGPGIPLNVNGGAIIANNLSLNGDGTNARVKTTTTSGHLTLGSNNIDQIIIAGNGNIGIANLVPTTKLAVLGSTYLGGGDLILGTGTDLAKIKANNTFGTDKQVLMSNATGGSYWGLSTAVAGLDTQVQFNDGGALGATSGFTFAKASNTVTIGNNLITVANATVGAGLTVVTNSVTIGTTAYVVANGNIGIGTNVPDRKLTVNNYIQVEGSVPVLSFKDTDNATDAKFWDIIADATTHSYRITNDAYTVSNTWMQVTRNVGAITNISFPTSANVGIGVTAALAPLHIKAATNPIIRLEGATESAFLDFNGSILNVSANAQSMKFTTGQAERININAAGDITFGVANAVNSYRYIKMQNIDIPSTTVGISGITLQLLTKALNLTDTAVSEITRITNGPNAGQLIIRNGDGTTSTENPTRNMPAGKTATIQMVAGSTTGLSIDTSGNVVVPTGSLYAKIYYDQDDAAYFLDPASASRLNVVQAAGRFWTGYDSGILNSVSASGWFRSNGTTGWVNDSYNGGVYMTDATAVRVYTASGTKKKFIVENGTEATYFSATASGATQNLTYTGTLISSKTAGSGQHINLIRTAGASPVTAAAAWSIGYDYNTSNFAIGYGRTSDADFTGANVVFSISTGGVVSLGSSISLGNTTCNTVANSSALTVSNTLSIANLTPFALTVSNSITTSTVTAVTAYSNTGIGINGVSNTNIGLFGKSTSLTGVSGVSNTGTGITAVSNTGTGLTIQSNTGIVATFANATAEFMRITPTGNVGISNSAPQHKLSINGTTYVETSINIGSGVANLVANTTTIQIANSTTVANLTPGSLVIGNVTTTSTTTGVAAYSLSGNGIYGFSNTGSGVQGYSNTGQAVYGLTDTGFGLRSFANSGIGLSVISNTGVVAIFANATSEFMRIASNGNTAIGSTNTDYKFRVENNFNGGAQFLIYNSNTGTSAGSGLELKYAGSLGAASMYYGPGSNLNIYSAGPINFFAAGDNRMVVGYNGGSNVAIGFALSVGTLNVDQAGPAITGLNQQQTAVYGVSYGGIGVDGRSNTNNGVYGSSNTGYGGYFVSNNGPGILGYALTNAYGVNGISNTSVGVGGFSNSWVGVYGKSNTAWGGYFESNTGPPLYVGNTGGAEFLRVAANGNVGIGVAAPAVKLSVEGSIRANTYSATAVSGICDSGAGVYGISTYSTGVIGFSPNSTGVRGQSTSGTGGFFISATGVLISAANGSGSQFSVENNGSVRSADNITAYYSSDISLKENIEVIPDALDKISKIRGVSFDWTEEYIKYHGGEDDYFMRRRDVGVIAQEIEIVLPEVVATRVNGTKAVKYERIVPLLIEAIKELKAEIEQLKGNK